MCIHSLANWIAIGAKELKRRKYEQTYRANEPVAPLSSQDSLLECGKEKKSGLLLGLALKIDTIVCGVSLYTLTWRHLYSFSRLISLSSSLTRMEGSSIRE